jgi:hypothetical protein
MFMNGPADAVQPELQERHTHLRGRSYWTSSYWTSQPQAERDLSAPLFLRCSGENGTPKPSFLRSLVTPSALPACGDGIGPLGDLNTTKIKWVGR